MLSLQFWLKLGCRVSQTLGWHHQSSYVSLGLFFVYVGVHGYRWRSLNGILPVWETPEQLHGLKNVTRASINKVVRIKWVKFQFWTNYPFKYTMGTLVHCEVSCVKWCWHNKLKYDPPPLPKCWREQRREKEGSVWWDSHFPSQVR